MILVKDQAGGKYEENNPSKAVVIQRNSACNEVEVDAHMKLVIFLHSSSEVQWCVFVINCVIQLA